MAGTVVDNLPALDRAQFRVPDPAALSGPVSRHPPRILLLHGSLRVRSHSRFLANEADRDDPFGPPLPDDANPSYPKVHELRALSLWSEGQIWSSPERHGALTGVMKGMIDWLPLKERGVRPTQGRTPAVIPVAARVAEFALPRRMHPVISARVATRLHPLLGIVGGLTAAGPRCFTGRATAC